jgi:hypothetical protein
MYRDAPLRRPTFDFTRVVNKTLKSIGSGFVSIYESFVYARRLQAAMQIAQHLKATNKDFRHMSLGDIVNQIIKDEE